ncbi:hypothetical protein LAUMK4_05540 [Mycobacterium persicum]|uniref:Uncharacterized protein n=1 Tax=Mycobacterium persicum TaxID=1487726 RepID=A0AB38ULI0_9MYCO|nr:hypothetical protein A4G31_13780 [Mycobacterium persicum]VAZ70329.1 hypothetical protein LAUMK15_00270 [Mycobacterium persicum]VAZ81335.1 hypothetical protein LAUMK42_00136 [Mycobacterium persicum]VBA31683.1 hypothetical protein LAUMK4_05540 [Mycobacterium persicum]
MDHNPLARCQPGDLGPDLPHHPGKLMPEWHRRPARSGESAEADVGEVATTDAAGVDLHESVPRTAGRQVHAIERYAPRRMDANLPGSG